jgi:hypothetical protein
MRFMMRYGRTVAHRQARETSPCLDLPHCLSANGQTTCALNRKRLKGSALYAIVAATRFRSLCGATRKLKKSAFLCRPASINNMNLARSESRFIRGQVDRQRRDLGRLT